MAGQLGQRVQTQLEQCRRLTEELHHAQASLTRDDKTPEGTRKAAGLEETAQALRQMLSRCEILAGHTAALEELAAVSAAQRAKAEQMAEEADGVRAALIGAAENSARAGLTEQLAASEEGLGALEDQCASLGQQASSMERAISQELDGMAAGCEGFRAELDDFGTAGDESVQRGLMEQEASCAVLTEQLRQREVLPTGQEQAFSLWQVERQADATEIQKLRAQVVELEGKYGQAVAALEDQDKELISARRQLLATSRFLDSCSESKSPRSPAQEEQQLIKQEEREQDLEELWSERAALLQEVEELQAEKTNWQAERAALQQLEADMQGQPVWGGPGGWEEARAGVEARMSTEFDWLLAECRAMELELSWVREEHVALLERCKPATAAPEKQAGGAATDTGPQSELTAEAVKQAVQEYETKLAAQAEEHREAMRAAAEGYAAKLALQAREHEQSMRDAAGVHEAEMASLEDRPDMATTASTDSHRGGDKSVNTLMAWEQWLWVTKASHDKSIQSEQATAHLSSSRLTTVLLKWYGASAQMLCSSAQYHAAVRWSAVRFLEKQVPASWRLWRQSVSKEKFTTPQQTPAGTRRASSCKQVNDIEVALREAKQEYVTALRKQAEEYERKLARKSMEHELAAVRSADSHAEEVSALRVKLRDLEGRLGNPNGQSNRRLSVGYTKLEVLESALTQAAQDFKAKLASQSEKRELSMKTAADYALEVTDLRSTYQAKLAAQDREHKRALSAAADAHIQEAQMLKAALKETAKEAEEALAGVTGEYETLIQQMKAAQATKIEDLEVALKEVQACKDNLEGQAREREISIEEAASSHNSDTEALQCSLGACRAELALVEDKHKLEMRRVIESHSSELECVKAELKKTQVEVDEIEGLRAALSGCEAKLAAQSAEHELALSSAADSAALELETLKGQLEAEQAEQENNQPDAGADAGQLQRLEARMKQAVQEYETKLAAQAEEHREAMRAAAEGYAAKLALQAREHEQSMRDAAGVHETEMASLETRAFEQNRAHEVEVASLNTRMSEAAQGSEAKLTSLTREYDLLMRKAVAADGRKLEADEAALSAVKQESKRRLEEQAKLHDLSIQSVVEKYEEAAQKYEETLTNQAEDHKLAVLKAADDRGLELKALERSLEACKAELESINESHELKMRHAADKHARELRICMGRQKAMHEEKLSSRDKHHELAMKKAVAAEIGVMKGSLHKLSETKQSYEVKLKLQQDTHAAEIAELFQKLRTAQIVPEHVLAEHEQKQGKPFESAIFRVAGTELLRPTTLTRDTADAVCPFTPPPPEELIPVAYHTPLDLPITEMEPVSGSPQLNRGRRSLARSPRPLDAGCRLNRLVSRFHKYVECKEFQKLLAKLRFASKVHRHHMGMNPAT